MTVPELPPEVARELADLRRQVQDLQRVSSRPKPLAELADVTGAVSQDWSVPSYTRTTGRWEPRHGRVRPILARLGADTDLTTTYQTLITLPTFDTYNPGTVVLARIVCDFQVALIGPEVLAGRALIGGAAFDTSEAIMHQDATRATVFQTYAKVVATPSGPHTVQLQARKLVNAGIGRAMGVHTSIEVLVLP